MHPHAIRLEHVLADVNEGPPQGRPLRLRLHPLLPVPKGMHDGRPGPNRRLNPDRVKVRILGLARRIESLDDGEGSILVRVQSVVHGLPQAFISRRTFVCSGKRNLRHTVGMAVVPGRHYNPPWVRMTIGDLERNARQVRNSYRYKVAEWGSKDSAPPISYRFREVG